MAQQTFETRIGRFKNGNTLIQSWGDYNSNNPLISKPNLPLFITAVEDANTLVAGRLETLGNLRTERSLKMFTTKNADVNCLENRVRACYQYTVSVKGQAHSTSRQILALLRKINPPGIRNTRFTVVKLNGGQSKTVDFVVPDSQATNTGLTELEWRPAGSTEPFSPWAPEEVVQLIAPKNSVEVRNRDQQKQGKCKILIHTDKKTEKSQSERTYTAIVGYARTVHKFILNMGSAWQPPNPAIEAGNFLTFIGQMDTLNQNIALALEMASNARDNRKKLYDDKNGLRERTALIKSYLASFEGGKKSQHYIEFADAIAGV